MADRKPDVLAELVRDYQGLVPQYCRLRETVEGALRSVTGTDHPGAVVTGRVKSVAGFAEKVSRKGYEDPLEEMTDLLGVRVILQNSAEVAAVRAIIEAMFEVHERQDKQVLLGLDSFGYRDLHLVVSIPVERSSELWGGNPVADDLVGLRFEVQVRTWLQHAWAELVHDRMYKATVQPRRQEKRQAAALAALLEEGDRIADGLAGSIDRRQASYTQWAPRSEVIREIDLRTVLLDISAVEHPAVQAIALARMQRAVGDLDGAIDTLGRSVESSGAARAELGHCLCLRGWEDPESEDFRNGVQMLGESVQEAVETRAASEQARRLSRLAWATSREPDGFAAAADLLQRAMDLDRDNPYLLSDALTMRHAATSGVSFDVIAEREVRRAIEVCEQHAADGLELPRAHFTAARLCLLIGRRLEALSHYARGLTRLSDPEVCGDPLALDWERNWVELMEGWTGLEEDLAWVGALLAPVEPASELTRVVVDQRQPAALDRVPGLVTLAGLSRPAHEPPAGSTTEVAAGDVLHAVREFRQRAGGGPNALLVDVEGGEPIYSRVALALGAKVAISGGAQPGSVLADPLWSETVPTLMPIADDDWTVREIVTDPSAVAFPGGPADADAGTGSIAIGELDAMAREIHRRYVADQLTRQRTTSGAMRDWDQLPATYRSASAAQAAAMIRILREAGFAVVPAAGVSDPVTEFTAEQVEKMAEMEHGRWSADRLRDGWRPSTERDDRAKRHDNLVSWSMLPDTIADYDRSAVRNFPAVLEKVGLAIVRLS